MGFLYNKLLKPLLFTDYDGLPVSGKHAVKEASAILIDRARPDPFEKAGGFREVPVHFYYPEPDEKDPERFPLVVFSHGAFGFYKSNYSTYARSLRATAMSSPPWTIPIMRFSQKTPGASACSLTRPFSGLRPGGEASSTRRGNTSSIPAGSPFGRLT